MEWLYEVAAEFAQLRGHERVFDLYCGIGTIGLTLARNAGEIWGLETVSSAIADAEHNARRNEVANVRFRSVDVRLGMRPLIEEAGRPDVIVVDPPRAGLSPKIVRRVIEADAPRIVYVSCDPATLALCKRVSTRVDPRAQADFQKYMSGSVRIQTGRGAFETHVQVPKGEPANFRSAAELRAKFDGSYDNVPATYIWSRLVRMTDTRDKTNAKEMMCFLTGGYNMLIQALARAITERGGLITTGAAVEQVRVADGRVMGLRLASGEIRSDAVQKLHAKYPSAVADTPYGNGTMTNIDDSAKAGVRWLRGFLPGDAESEKELNEDKKANYKRGCVSHQGAVRSALVPAGLNDLEIKDIFLGAVLEEFVSNRTIERFLTGRHPATMLVASTTRDLDAIARTEIEESGLAPYLGPFTGPYADAAREAVNFGFGASPAFIREGGSIGAVVTMQRHLKAPIMFIGLSLPEHGYHAPNENFDWGQASGGIKTFAHYFATVAQMA